MFRRLIAGTCLAVALHWPAVASADSLTLSLTADGLDPAAQDNILQRVSAYHYQGVETLSPRRIRIYADRAETEAAEALRPFGYYHAVVVANLNETSPGRWTLTLDVRPGEPIRIGSVDVRVEGPGADERTLRDWQTEFPLSPGMVLDQAAWAAAKRDVLDRADQIGYFLADWQQAELRLDLDARRADATLVLDTGPRARFGNVTYEGNVVRSEVLIGLPEFSRGDAYSLDRVDTLRDDLERTAWYRRIEVRERRDLDASPPQVDLAVRLEPREPNTYQAAVGFGTDTGPRIQFDWTRYRLSRAGDSLRLGFGYQQTDNEFVLAGEYRYPRRNAGREYWLGAARLLLEDDDIVFLDEDTGEQLLPAIEGRRRQGQLRFGRQELRRPWNSREALLETVFVEALRESFDVEQPVPPETASLRTPFGRPLPDLLDRDTTAVSLGYRLEWPEFHGSGFNISGHHEQLQVLGASESLGSDLSFWQVYGSTRWEIPLGERWKFIGRGELGISDATVRAFSVETPDGTVNLSLTELPSEYRFRAGGDRSVRGYGFEDLSDNRWGSNNLVTASAEVEYRVWQDWSAAVFADIGNAFNDRGDPDLKLGAGIGVRWYTLAGPLKLDVARAFDLPGEPWTIHFTIGSILL